MTFSELLKTYRKKRKLTIRQLEQLTGISNAFICQVENGAEISLSRALLLSKILGFSISKVTEFK